MACQSNGEKKAKKGKASANRYVNRSEKEKTKKRKDDVARYANRTVQQKESNASQKARRREITQAEKDQFVAEFKRNNSVATPVETARAFRADKKQKATTKIVTKTMLSLRTHTP